MVGMSLGGLTALACRPGARPRARLARRHHARGQRVKSKPISTSSPAPNVSSFDELLAYAIEHNPTRSISSLRRGILHNAIELYDGSWVWRYRRHGERGIVDGPAAPFDRFGELWEVLGAVTVPVLLVRGMRPQSVVDDDDEVELLRRLPGVAVAHVEHAGHSVQGDTPVELAVLLDGFVQRASRGERERRHRARDRLNTAVEGCRGASGSGRW